MENNKDDTDLFNDEKSLFRKKINSILQENPVTEIISDLIRLHMLRVASKDDSQLILVEVYNLLGAEQFAELVELINGRKITFPDSEGFKETIEIALSYYFKYIQGRSWDEIKILLQNSDVSSIKYGINCTRLQNFISELSSISMMEQYGVSGIQNG
jgi:hypothetical protein